MRLFKSPPSEFRPVLEAHILTPQGMVVRKKVKSHRAYSYRYGLYDVDYRGIFRVLRWDGKWVKHEGNMILHSLGNPVPFPLCEEEGEEKRLTDKILRGVCIDALSDWHRWDWKLPAWVFTVFLLVVFLVVVM